MMALLHGKLRNLMPAAILGLLIIIFFIFSVVLSIVLSNVLSIALSIHSFRPFFLVVRFWPASAFSYDTSRQHTHTHTQVSMFVCWCARSLFMLVAHRSSLCPSKVRALSSSASTAERRASNREHGASNREHEASKTENTENTDNTENVQCEEWLQVARPFSLAIRILALELRRISNCEWRMENGEQRIGEYCRNCSSDQMANRLIELLAKYCLSRCQQKQQQHQPDAAIDVNSKRIFFFFFSYFYCFFFAFVLFTLPPLASLYTTYKGKNAMKLTSSDIYIYIR